jgi:hypothetical protein
MSWKDGDVFNVTSLDGKRRESVGNIASLKWPKYAKGE